MTGDKTAAVGAALERITAENGRINAFRAVMAEEALAAASGPATGHALDGVPFAVKDLFDVAGHTTRAGSKMREGDAPAAQDATALARLRAAGAVLTGTLNMDEFAYGFTGENAHTGPTRNPHDPDHVAGGSSAGSGAAVAAGLVPFALGSDTNGSVRVPAALCGVHGLKPTYGRISRAGVAPLSWSFDHVGILARTVHDIALVLDTIQGPDARDPAASTASPPPTLGMLDEGIGGLRIARGGGHFATVGLPEAFEAADRVAKALNATRTMEIEDSGRAVQASLMITSAEAASLHLEDIRHRDDQFDPNTRARWIAAAMIPSVWVSTAQRFRRSYQARMKALFEEIDVLVTPTTPFPPPRIGQSTIVIDGNELPTRGTLGRFTAPFSFVGVPAMSVPVDVGGRFPMGVQLVAAPGNDALLLRSAAWLTAHGTTVS